ncbi:MAG: hypothetical protein IKN00_04090 [Bacteroidales bacterium]|nr:hypothetical protein [Bacteroidales bacterium]
MKLIDADALGDAIRYEIQKANEAGRMVPNIGMALDLLRMMPDKSQKGIEISGDIEMDVKEVAAVTAADLINRLMTNGDKSIGVHLSIDPWRFEG